MYNDDEQQEQLPTENKVDSEQKEQAPELTLTGYCMKTRQKGVPILDAVLSKTAKGTFIAQGHDGQGHKMTTIVAAAKAQALVAAGMAKMAG